MAQRKWFPWHDWKARKTAQVTSALTPSAIHIQVRVMSGALPIVNFSMNPMHGSAIWQVPYDRMIVDEVGGYALQRIVIHAEGIVLKQSTETI